MHSFELKPTHENFLETLCNDSLGRNSDLFYFIQILNNINDGCSISLDGGWGSGKTFFVNQVKMIFDASNCLIHKTNDSKLSEKEEILEAWKQIKEKRQIDLVDHVTVYYDAWENDNDEDPVISLIYSILKSGVSDCQFTPDVNVDYKELVCGIIHFFSGKDYSKLANAFKSDNPIEAIHNDKSVKEKINEFFESLLPERGERLVIFIDELDRCNPRFAVRLLERIKHYFTDDRITFVFSVNICELQHTIRQYYGAQFDALKYLSRFFDRRASLPKINFDNFLKSVGLELTRYLFDAACNAVINYFNFEIREVAQYLQAINSAARKTVLNQSYISRIEQYKEGLDFAIHLFVPVLVGLKMHNQSLYQSFVEGKEESVLSQICSSIDEGYFFILYSKQKSQEEQFAVNLIIEFYQIIFGNTVDLMIDDNPIGSLILPNNIKSTLIKITNLFSDYACNE